MFRPRVPQMQQAIAPPQPQPPAQIMPATKVEVIEKRKTLYDKSIDNKKTLNEYKDYLPKAKFNALWNKASLDPLFNVEDEIEKAMGKSSHSSDDLASIVSKQKKYIKQLERLIKRLQK